MANKHLSSFVFVAAFISMGSMNAIMANSLEVNYKGQTPPNVVPVGQSITYNLQTRNVSDYSVESDGISTGLAIRVNGSRIDADSGVFTATGCFVDASYPSYWACGALSRLGDSESISFTWTSPEFGTSVIEFNGYCQEWPVPRSGTHFCNVNDNSWGSVVATVTTHYIAPDPVVNIASSESIVIPGSQVTLSWSSSNADSCAGSWTGITLPTNGNANVTVNSETTYTITCVNSVGSANDSVVVQIRDLPTASISVSDNPVVPGTQVTLSWSSSNADSCAGSWTGITLPTNGNANVTVNSETTYTITCVNSVGSAQDSVLVQVQLPARIFQDGFES